MSPRRTSKALRSPFVVTVAALGAALAACGGNASSGTSGNAGSAGSAGSSGSGGSTATGGSSGSSGSGGSSGSSGSSGSGGTGGGDSPCPTSPPGTGTACAGDVDCWYDPCEHDPSYYTCEGGVWVPSGGSSCNPPPPFECPPELPVQGEWCWGEDAEQQVCSYDSGPCCPPNEARCINGAWEISEIDCNPPPPDPCPEQQPAAGTACGGAECSNPYRSCGYGDCGGSGQPEVLAVCDGSTWSLQPQCVGIDAGAADGG
jgi:hypothetical protein